MYVYEATITYEEGGEFNGPYWLIEVPQFSGLVTDGVTIEEAVENAAGFLQLLIAEYLDTGKLLPKPVFSNPPKVILCVDVTDEFIATSKCLTITEAAEELGITHGRVCQLLDDGQLETYMNGGQRMVTIASVNERKTKKRGAGRPRKE